MPNNDRIYRKYADQGVVLLAVCASDSRENYRGWVQRNAENWKFRMVFDPAGKAGWDDSVFHKDYHVTGFPTMFVIGRDGKLVETVGSGGPGEDHRLEYALARAGAKVDLASLPPEKQPDPNAPKSVPMVTKTPAIRMATPPVGSKGLLPEKFGSVAQGEAVPDFTLEDKDGKPLALSSLKGKRVLLHFHTSNGPQPWLEPLAKAYADQNVTTLCVFSASDKEAFTKWLQGHPSPGFLVAWDKAGKAWAENVTNTLFGIGMYPATAVVGADGKLVSGTIGMGDKVAVMVKAMLAKTGVKLTAEDQAAVTAAEAAAKPAPVPAADGKK
jgi:peroxiredoxin